jgi:large subunit ribosomal protein L20
MSRVKGGTVTHARHKKILKAAKGYYDRRGRTFKVATQAVDKANQYATRDRRARKRNFRALWIQRINAAVRAEGMTYGVFMHGLKLAGVELDRKVLADLAMNEGAMFSTIIAQSKAALAKAA